MITPDCGSAHTFTRLCGGVVAATTALLVKLPAGCKHAVFRLPTTYLVPARLAICLPLVLVAGYPTVFQHRRFCPSAQRTTLRHTRMTPLQFLQRGFTSFRFAVGGLVLYTFFNATTHGILTTVLRTPALLYCITASACSLGSYPFLLPVLVLLRADYCLPGWRCTVRFYLHHHTVAPMTDSTQLQLADRSAVTGRLRYTGVTVPDSGFCYSCTLLPSVLRI